MGVSLQRAELGLLQEYYRQFETDPALFMDMSRFAPYRYDPHKVEEYYSAKIDRPDRRCFVIMLGMKPIGELLLKNIDREKGTCELSIHLQNDSVKGKGYGTQAERLALREAFEGMDMKTVFADSVLKNGRSQHVLEKVGFRLVGENETMKYYRCDREQWNG